MLFPSSFKDRPFQGWFIPSLTLQVFQQCTHCLYNCSAHFAISWPPLLVPSTFSRTMDFSKELGLHIMYPKYDHLSLFICALSENSGLICSVIHLIVFLATSQESSLISKSVSILLLQWPTQTKHIEYIYINIQSLYFDNLIKMQSVHLLNLNHSVFLCCLDQLSFNPCFQQVTNFSSLFHFFLLITCNYCSAL